MENQLGRQIKKYRAAGHLSQESVANALGVSRTVFTQMENGKRKITAEDAVKLAALFRISTDALLCVNDEAPVSPPSGGIVMPETGTISALLANVFEAIFFINTEDDSYLLLQNRGVLRDLNTDVTGRDFFAETDRHLRLFTHRDDYREIASFLQKEALLAAVKNGVALSPVFRVTKNERTVYYRTQAFVPENAAGHLVVAVENVDSCVTDDQVRSRKMIANQQLIELLSSEYSSIYYVDLTTETFEICKMDDETRAVMQNVFRENANFSEAYRLCVQNIVHEFDREKMLNAASVYHIVSELRERSSFVTEYRSSGTPPHYCEMKIARVGNDPLPKTVVIGFADRNEEKNRELEKARNIRNVIRLARNFEAVFDVDLQSGRYDCFFKNGNTVGDNDFSMMNGGDFFHDLPQDIDASVCEEDRLLLKQLFGKDAVSRLLREHPEMEMDYRRLRKGRPVQYHIKAVLDRQDRRDRLIVGIFDVEEERRREQYYQSEVLKLRQSADYDVLTRSKNRNAYMRETERLSRRMAEGDRAPFGIALFDINNLKKTNDAFGHSRGDELIIETSQLIAAAFPECPVFRIGGDEFVVLIEGDAQNDYRERIAAFHADSLRNVGTARPVVAAGCAWRQDEDGAVSDVFSRADRDMYRRKGELKRADAAFAR